MSYDVDLVVDTGRTHIDHDGIVKSDPISVWDGNITYNLGPMMRAAGVELRDLHNLPAPAVANILSTAIGKMNAHPNQYREFDSPNGWGVYEDCLSFLTGLRDACQAHPRTTVEVH